MYKKIPTLNDIFLYLTDSCNLHCSHCWVNPDSGINNKKEWLTLEELDTVFEQGKKIGLRTVKITGGEPLLYPKIIELFYLLRKHDLRIHMETNGTLMTEEIGGAIRETKVFHISVSIDGSNREIHERLRGVEGSFEKALNGLRILVKNKIPVQVIASIYKGNASDIENIARLAKAEGATSIKLNFINVVGRGTIMEKNSLLLSIPEVIDICKKYYFYINEKIGIRCLTNIPMAFKPLKELFKRRSSFCKIKNLLGVLANGRVSICGIGEEVPELILGDLRKQSLKYIWENSPILNEIRASIPSQLEGICQRCILKNRCLGYCIADNYWRFKNFTSSYYFCQQAYELGLFPKSKLI